MNKQETIEAIKVMQAYVDGKTVETRAVGATEWHKVDMPDWALSHQEYRIKPEPKVIYVNEYCELLGSAYPTKESAQKGSMNNDATRIAVKYQEVIE